MSMTIPALLEAYAQGRATPTSVVEGLLERSAAAAPHAVWISPPRREALLARAAELEARGMDGLPLFGIPFAVKDNIDVAGWDTTCACPEYAYAPTRSASVVERLLAAGAIMVGKTNMDQFATGLNGTRSPYGACRNAFDRDYVAGGSSSGSAVAVALGLASFALGTDTAGSGRVPAAFNNLVGLKPTRGLLSTAGVVPACRSLDAVSVFALAAGDARRVFAAALGEDPADPYSRPARPHGPGLGGDAPWRFGVPAARQLEFLGDAEAAALFDAAVGRLRSLGGEAVEIDLEPFLEVARLLYEGPWVAERYLAIRDFFETHPQALFPVTRDITLGGARPSAADAFAAQYRLRELARRCDAVWTQVDCVLTPTTPTIFTIEAMLAEPVRRNSELGLYTNFMNLLDYSAVAVPAGFRADGLPLGVTLFGPAHQDLPLLRLAERWQTALALPCGARETVPPAPDPDAAGSAAVEAGWRRIVVVGAHLSGMALNPQLTDRGARRVAVTHTAPSYRLHALADGRRPALQRVVAGGVPIACEVWELEAAALASFIAAIPAPLGVGQVELVDGSSETGFICEPIALAGARDISDWGGWRAWVEAGRPGG